MLSRRGHRTAAAADGEEAWERIQDGGIDLVCTDLRMPRLDGIELLRRMRESGLDLPVILMTAHGSLDSAVEALRLGACDYLLRPFDVEALELAIDRVFATRGLMRQNDFLRAEVSRDADGLVGDSSAMRRVRSQIAQVAPARASVLLTGETGTGKEVAARAIHLASPRRDQLFVPVNCAAIPAEMLESELFGHEKGAFTGAIRQRIGKFELSSGGTMFLDELTEMPIGLQAKLLRVVETQELQRVGGNDGIALDLRLVAATNRSPEQAVRDGRLREDLYFRLNVFGIELPPLRERREDIPALLAHFLGATGRSTSLAPGLLDHLATWHWPGNARELRNLVERALIVAGGQPLAPSHFAFSSQPAVPPPSPGPDLAADLRLEPAVDALERRLIDAALRECEGHKGRAAQRLGISERTLWYKLKKLEPQD
jgi:two-component system response regulator AtoC